MERWAARGGSVRLRCVHDVPPHLLDKVVFLRHGTKIFQYIRDRKPPYRNFTTPGAVLNVSVIYPYLCAVSLLRSWHTNVASSTVPNGAD